MIQKCMLAAVALCCALGAAAGAQERAYFIAYDHQMEEPGNLEITLAPLFATQRRGGDFLSSWLELEYGLRGWWTTELYLEGQATRGGGTVFTGLRWENRWRPLLREHWINPVLYFEVEELNGADKTLLEVVGHDVEADHAVPNREARRERLHELEGKLILSSHVEAWSLTANVIAEKKLTRAPWELGYALGASRPLALEARPERCMLCPENFVAGLELYGGLGDADRFGLHDTSHYLAPILSWTPPGGATFRISPGFGLNRNSHRFLLRFGASYEITRLASRLRPRARGKA